jgi:hypothetical protein
MIHGTVQVFNCLATSPGRQIEKDHEEARERHKTAIGMCLWLGQGGALGRSSTQWENVWLASAIWEDICSDSNSNILLRIVILHQENPKLGDFKRTLSS